MKTFRNIFFLFFSLLVSLTFHSFYQVSEPENNEQQLLAKANLLSLQYPQEKVYLHLDRPSYWANDDIWFKAYVKNSPVKESNLYVEIINSEGFVVYKNISWVQNGLAYGDIHIDENLPSGIYQIRAYTNWMRNFDEEWYFRKDLVIWNLSDKDKLPESKAIKQRDIDLQFFPEGGTFVAGLKNKVAFKAVNDFGKGIDFTGEIIDDSGNKIIGFESLYNGMGSFVLEPQEGKKYTAKVEFQGDIVKNIKLPEAQKDGFTLAIESTESDKINILISSKSAKKDVLEVLIIGQAEGVVCYREKISTSENGNKLEIEKSDLPGGIVKFTLFNSDQVPVCERLVFNNYINVVDLNVQTGKTSFLPRDSVLVEIQAISADGMPNFANLSMSVYNPDNQLENNKYTNNIFTHFLFNSELKGNIENPSYYFKDESLATQTALDNLMLTHGYRYFEWEEILSDETPEILYQPESSIEFKGRVVSMLTEKPLEDCKVTMMTVKSLLGVYEATTDSLGLFTIPNLFFYDTLQVSIQALNRKGNRNTIIQLDRSSIVSPEVNFLPVLYEFKEDKQVETLTYLSKSQEDIINRKWKLSDTILLEEIYVTAQKKASDDGHFRIYNEADFVFDMNEQQKLDVGNVYDAIEGRFPGVRHEEIEERFVYRSKPLMIYLDGIPADYDLLKTFPAEAFDKIELVRMGIFAGINSDSGILFFYTKRGEKFINMPTDKVGMKSAKIVGYSPIRKFYSPSYETTKQPTVLNDYRNTIYWNPIVRTDSTGVAQVSFFNSDETGNLQIVVEGITADGKLCRGLGSYMVKH